jgi:hypothetical protein
MSMAHFDLLVQQRKELKAWMALGETIAAYDRQKHSLRVDVAKPTMVAFCGQAYAGARNYHDAPAFFVEALRAEMQARACGIVRETAEKELARIDAKIEAMRADVLAQLSVA